MNWLSFFLQRESASATLRAYKIALNCDSFSGSMILRLIDCLKETWSVADKSRSGRQSLKDDRAIIEEDEQQTQQSNLELGSATSCLIFRATGIPKTSVQNIFRNKLHFYQYRQQKSQSLTNANKEGILFSSYCHEQSALSSFLSPISECLTTWFVT